tara:strand:+ start:359 stop:1525 length:1167 start_codon:yes stop_codon:yes gene_type:complete
MKKLISILGSTGSIGLNTLNIIKKNNIFKVNLLSADKNYRSICHQIKKYKPKYFLINNYKTYLKVKRKFKKDKIKILNKMKNLKIKKSDVTVSAIPGLAGLQPTISMIKFSKKLLIANKESIICGWHLIKKNANVNNTKIIPVDSEHYSIKELIKNHKIEEVEKIYLTASGGPFLNKTLSKIKNAKPLDALKHPKWKMGKKISVDSATLMNKILELIEAQKLFNLPENKIAIIIHPESLVHAIVVLKNGLLKFIYHSTTMKIPLANAIFDGNLEIKNFINQSERNKIKNSINDLSFQEVNQTKFPIIKLKARANEYPSTSIIINAANEVLVDYFLQKKIPFNRIIKTIQTIMNDRNYKKYAIRKAKNITQINKIDFWARNKTLEKIKQ